MTEEETTVCQAQLAEAKAALHKLRLGQAIVSVQYGERRVQYSALNLKDLQEYVAELENLCGTPVVVVARRGPFNIIW